MELPNEAKKTLQRLFKSPDMFEMLFVNSHIGLVICQQETGQLVVANKAFAEMTGYDQAELVNLCYKDMVPEEAMQWIREVIVTKLENENASDVFDHRIVQKTGGRVWLQSRIYKISDDFVLVKHIDITEAKITEAELMRSLNLQKKPLPKTVSGTERAIARLVAAGMSSKEIADHVNLAPRTVDNHRSNIRRKLNVSNTFALKDTLQSYRI